MSRQNEILLDEVVSISEKAGVAIMDIYSNGAQEAAYKDDGSPLTLADTASHNIILSELEKIRPDIPVLSEESESLPFDLRKSWKTFWLVDPLDGTKEFIKRNGEFTVNIALINNGKATLGVVHAPESKVTYYADIEKGAFKRGRDNSINEYQLYAPGFYGGKLKVVASRSHGSEAMERFKKNIGDAEYVNMGSSLKLCLIAEGKADIYPRLAPTMEWDTAAAQCIVESAGGAVTDLRKKPLCYNKPDLVNPFFIATGKPSFSWWDFIDNNLDKGEI